MPHEEPLIPVFIPPLLTLLANAEKRKGSPLTRDEVVAIRGGGICMMMAPSRAAAMAKRRGYDDIDPRQAWEQWQVAREQLKPLGGEA
ncbi:MAG TPA: hypothetical protein VF796_26840 [Humisphaera sp.]